MSKLAISAKCTICDESFKFPSGVNQLGFHVHFAQFDLDHDKCEKLAAALKAAQEEEKKEKAPRKAKK